MTPPRWLTAALVLLAALAVVALWISAWPRWTLLLPVILIGLSLRQRRYGLGDRLHLLDDGSLRRVAEDRSEHPLTLLSAQSRGPLHVLRLLDDCSVRSVLFCQPGNLDGAQQRRLRLWLQRFGSTMSPDDGIGGAI